MMRYSMLFMMLLVLIGCSDNAPKDGYDQVTGIDRANEYSSDEDFAPEETTTEETHSTEVTVETMEDVIELKDVATYQRLTNRIFIEWNQVISDFTDINVRSEEDEEYNLSASYRNSLNLKMSTIDRLMLEMQEIEIPEVLFEAQDHFSKAFEHFEFVTTNYTTALDNNDEELYQKCLEEWSSAVDTLQNGITIVNDYNGPAGE